MNIAPHVAAWQEEWEGSFGEGNVVSLGPNDTGHPTVEMFVSESWTDITPYVRWDEGVSIRRGRSSESSETDFSSCSMTLDNRDGRFSTRNPLGPYFGQLRINTPIRVSVIRNGSTNYRFYGEVSEWPLKWDISANDANEDRDVTVNLVASGVIRRLTQNQEILKSAMYRNIVQVAAGTGSIVGYWPLEEPSGSVIFESGLDDNAKPLLLNGEAPDAGGFSDFYCSDGALTLRTGSFAATVPAYTPGTEQFVRVLVNVPTTAPAGTQTIMKLTTTGTARFFIVQTNATFQVRLVVQDVDGANLYDSGFLTPTPAISGTHIALLLKVTQNGPDISFQVRFADIKTPVAWIPISVSTYTISNSLAGQTAGRLANISFGVNHGLDGWSFAHLVAVNASVIAGELTFAGASALLAYAGENPTNRIQRLCAEQGVDLQVLAHNQFGNTVGMGFQKPKAFMNLIRECVRTDGGLLFEPRDQIALGYRSRLSLYNQEALAALSYSGSDLGAVPDPVDDDRFVINDVYANNDSAPTASVNVRSTRETGPRNVQDPTADPEGIGRYQGSVQANLTTDQTNGVFAAGATTRLIDLAAWTVHLGTWDEERYPMVQVDFHRAQLRGNPTLTDHVLALEQGDRYDITGMPEWTSPDDVRQMVQGYEEFIGGSTLHQIRLQGTPIRPWTVAFADTAFDGLFPSADSVTSTLDSDISDTATSITVATTGVTLWTTNVVGSVDLYVGGERMVATAISGASSPQTFTVTRSQNGVVKAHKAGTSVRLWQQATIQL